MSFGPSLTWYEPPDEPLPCCEEGENDPSHDKQACIERQLEAAAERRAERMRDER